MVQIDASSRQCANPLHFDCIVVLRKIRRYCIGTSAVSLPTVFFNFSSELKKTRFNSVEAAEAKTSDVLNEPTQEVFQKCFAQ